MGQFCNSNGNKSAYTQHHSTSQGTVAPCQGSGRRKSCRCQYYLRERSRRQDPTETCTPAKTETFTEIRRMGGKNTITEIGMLQLLLTALLLSRSRRIPKKKTHDCSDGHGTACPELSAAPVKQSGNSFHGSNPAAGAECPAKESHDRANRHDTACPELSAAPVKQSGNSFHGSNPAAGAGLPASKQRDYTEPWSAATRAE